MGYTIYQQAISFKKAYERCMMYIKQDNSAILIVPAMVNSSFSVELFFKAILLENSKNFHTHSLVSLFNNLPFQVKEEIRKQTNTTLDFDLELQNFSKVFEESRYLYEDIFKTQKYNLQFWNSFIDAVFLCAPKYISNKGVPISIEL